MPAFRFRLAKALDWYREQCKIEEGRLANCVAALSAATECVARLEAERLAVDRETIAQASIAGCELAALGLYRLGAAEAAARLEEERRQRSSAVDRQRVVVQAARRRLKLLEKLRERRLAEHVQAEEREMENSAAESFLAKWVRTAAR